MDQLQTRLDALKQQMHTVTRRLHWWRGLACGIVVLGFLTWSLPTGTAQEEIGSSSAQEEKKTLEQRVAALESFLKHFSRKDSEVFITGANLHIVNGLGNTETTNALGNLIVGYNEPLPEGDEERIGSHNLIVSQQHDYTQFGGLVVGFANRLTGPYASITAGAFNLASGLGSTVSGGASNIASGELSAISAGRANQANDLGASVSGGVHNTAIGQDSSISGGAGNTATGIESSISGGRDLSQETDFGWAAGSFGDSIAGQFRSL